MAAFLECTNFMQGDFLDGVVESALRGIVGQIKVEYQRELGRALQTAAPEAAGKAGLASGAARLPAPPAAPQAIADASVAAAPGLNVPVTQLGEDQTDGTCQLKSASDIGLPLSDIGLPVVDNVDVIERIWLAPECLDVERPAGRAPVPPSAPRDSRLSGPQRVGIWEEAVERPRRSITRPSVALTKQDQEEIARFREEQIKREEVAERIVRDYAFVAEPVPDEASRCRKLLFSVVASPRFDFAMGFVIILNALAIGSETAISRQGGKIPASLHILEYTFLLLYCVELAMRVYVGGLQAFSNNWVRFDAVIVAAGMLNFMLTVALSGGEAEAAAGLVDNINMIKMVRLFRLAKTVRVFPQFRTLWMLVQGVTYSVMPMIWTALLMAVVMYVFAVMAMEMIELSDAEDDYGIASRHFDTLGGSILTLWQFMMFDSVGMIYRPLILTKPWLGIYFAVFLLLGPISLLNIVTAIMVESSLRTANEDQEAKKVWEQVRRKEMMPKLRQMFIDMDTSGDGEVDLQEVLNAPPHIKHAMQHIVGLDELEEIFNLLDYDGSGSIDIEEFVEGILRSKGEKPSELFVLLKQGKATLNRLNELSVRPPSVRTSAPRVADIY